MTTTLCYGYAFVRASVSDASTCPSLNTAGGWQLPVFASVGARALVVENAASWHTSPGKTTCFDSQKRSSSYGTVSTLIDSFMDLLHILRADLVVSNEKQARFAKWGQLVMPEVKLAIALRFLAGGSPLDLKLIYHVSTSFVYDSIWLVVDAVNKNLKMELPLDDTDKLATLEAEWRARARCPGWVGQIGALDGVHFPMKAPESTHLHRCARSHPVPCGTQG